MIEPLKFNVWHHLKTNYSLVPLIMVCTFGVTIGLLSSYRTLTRSPDVIVDRKHNPKPWEKMLHEDGSGVQYKYYQRTDYAKLNPIKEREEFKA